MGVKLDRILVAKDLSKESAHVVRYALELGSKFDAEVHVIGHTPIGRIQERYEGMLIAVDLERSGSEMLLLLRSGDGRRGRYVLGLTGPPVPLESSAGVDIR